MITFEALRRVFSEEKGSQALADLPENFFEEVKQYLGEKAKLVGKEDGWELASAKTTLEELLNIRERKIVNMALYSARSGIISETLKGREQEFFNELVAVLSGFQDYKKSLFDPKIRLMLISMHADIPRFVGMDMGNYGPYAAGDIANMPEDNARLLIEKGAAKEMKAGN